MLYIRGKENGEMLKDSVEHGPYKFKSEITAKDTDGVTDIRRAKRTEDLKGDDKLRYDNDIKAVNIILLGLPVDIYTLINHYQTAKEIWDRVKELMEGTKMTKQERESMLYDEFDKFTSEPEESIHSYYLRFAKLINDMNMISMTMTPMQINTKFLYAFLKHNKRDAKEVREMRQRFPEPLALLESTYNPPPSYSSNQTQNQAQPSEVYQPYQHYQSSTPITQQLIQSPPLQSYAPTVVPQPPTYQLDTGLAIPTFLLTDDPIASLNKAMIFLSLCTARKRVKDSEWFKDKMLLTQAQEEGVVLDEKQHDLLADSLEETDDSTANLIFIANLSPVGSLNDDTVASHYDSDTLFEVPHYDTYHDSDVLNSNIQELGYIKNIVSTNESYDELKGNNDVISYTDYMLTIRDDADNYVPPPIQKDNMMLSVIEQMKSQVQNCHKVNQESKSKIESLTSELERYKDRVRVLGYAVKDGHFEQEAYLNRELYIVINDRNRKVKDFEKQVFFQETQIKDLSNHIAFLKKNFETLKQESSENPNVTVLKPKVFPKKLPSTSEVLRNLNKARDLLTNFNECITRRTPLSPHEIGSWRQSDIKGAFKEDVIPFSENLKETFNFFEKGFITEVKEMKDIFEQLEDEVDQCSVANKSFKIEKKQLLINNDQLLEENIASDIMIQKLEDENMSLAFQVSSLVKEREHIKLEYKKQYDSIKQTRLKGNFSESQMNHNGTSVNTKLSKPSTSGTKLYSVTSFPKSKVIPKVVEKNDLSKSVTSHLTTNKIIEKCTKVLGPGLLKIETEPINAYFKNNRVVHRDYLKVTKKHVATLQDLLVEARVFVEIL
ncbi:hypothetical protein Tco_0417063 [Tanacetum coccineum]